MIRSRRVLGLIPARGGSKGIPRKNIRPLCGKPLIAYTIEEGSKSGHIDRLIVSTDDEEIAEVARRCGADVPFLRPIEYATDTSRAIEVVQHALDTMESMDKTEYHCVVYLEPPTPLRTVQDIDTAIEIFDREDPDSVVSVVEASQYHPILMKKIVDNRLECFCMEEPQGLPRQLYEPKAYMRNGAVYVIRRENIRKGIFWGEKLVPYIMPVERSVCIDDIRDFYMAEAFMRNE